MKSARREMGIDTSCLIFGPSWACASEMNSRRLQSFWAFSRLRVREFHQHIVWEAARERGGGIPEMLEHEREAKIGEQLEAREPLATSLQGSLEQCQGFFRTFQCDHGRGARLRQRKEFQNRRCDHAERSFRTDEKLLQIIAGVVLAQAAQA